jgi:hypothetical protein
MGTELLSHIRERHLSDSIRDIVAVDHISELICLLDYFRASATKTIVREYEQ